ncbi:unnamed protein product, partial [marine sediment metagenome]
GGAGQVRRIKTSTKDSITPQTDFDINPDGTSVFVIRTALATVSNKPAFKTGQKNVTSSGTAEQLPDVGIPDGFKAIVQAKPGNTDYIYLGNSKANAEDTSTRFDKLGPGDGVELQITNLNLVWIDADTGGEGISYFVEQDE